MKQRVLLTGLDAQDLLQRISTVNMNRIHLDVKTPALFLNPQGKILCYFEVTRKTNDSFEIDFDENFLEVLDHFTFGEKYKIETLPVINELPRDEKARILALTPKAGHEFKNDGQTNPLEVNLNNAIHENKGCYPGQEVIEKIISLGSPARKLCLLQGLTTESLPTLLFDETGTTEVGLLTSAIGDQALAIIKRTQLKVGTQLKTKNNSFIIAQIS